MLRIRGYVEHRRSAVENGGQRQPSLLRFLEMSRFGHSCFKPFLFWTALTVAYCIVAWLTIWRPSLEPAQAPGLEASGEASNRYHGADVITVGWDGEMTALAWDGDRYRVMWKRKRM